MTGFSELKVLLIDDDVVIRAQTADILGDFGIHLIDELNDAADARGMLSAYDYDLVLCDSLMPRMNGLDFAATSSCRQ